MAAPSVSMLSRIAAVGGLLLALGQAQAKPSGPGWELCVNSEGAHCERPAGSVVLWQDWGRQYTWDTCEPGPVQLRAAGVFYESEPVSVYFFTAGYCSMGEMPEAPGGGIYLRVLDDPDDTEPEQDLMQLWSIGLGCLTILWCMRSFILRLVTPQ